MNGLSYAAEAAASSSSNDSESEYERVLRPLLFGTAPVVITPNAPWSHAYATKSNETLNGREVKAVFKEITALKQSLPLALSSSVFVRYDDSHVRDDFFIASFVSKYVIFFVEALMIKN